ncbi:hypothetical protein ACO1O0_005923 [Amphichorda felina]
MAHPEKHVNETHTAVDHHGESSGDVLSVIGRVTTAQAQQDEPRRSEVFEVMSIAASRAPSLSNTKRNVIVSLVVCANLIGFVSMFSTVVGGFEFSRLLGRPVGPGQANWIAAAYSLTQSGFVLISGRLGDVYGHQWMLLAGGTILVIFSLTNAFCNTYESFVTARALTGIGGGIVMPNAVATLTVMIPPGTARNVTLAIFAASPPFGAMVGALFTGLFIEKAEWKWLFIFIALLGTLFYVSLFFIMPREGPVDKGGKIDFIGAFLGLSCLVLFSFTWNQAPSVGWDTPYIIVTLILSLALGGGFVLWENRFTNDPILPMGIFKAPSFGALIFVVLVTYMGFSISTFYMVAWQQIIRGWGVMQVSLGWLPFVFGTTFAVGLAAWLIPRLEAQWIMAFGIVSTVISDLLLATQPEQQTYWAQTFPAVLFGSLCPDFIFVAGQVIASSSVKKSQQGVAGSLVGTLNLYGNSLGLGFAGTIESQLHKSGAGTVLGYRAALYFGAALAAAALAMDIAFVRMPKNNQEGWIEESETDEEVHVPPRDMA